MTNKLNNLKALIRAIYQTILAAFLVITLLFATAWLSINYKQSMKEAQASKQEISATVNLLKSNLSEKLSLIANSPIFIQYLNSGPLTRKNTYIPFLTRVSELNSSMITGMSITQGSNALFHNGKPSPYHLTLRLCYLNQELNHTYGNCRFNWTLYFSKSQLIHSLQAMNPSLALCDKNCAHTNIFSEKHFGTFLVKESTPLKVGLKVNRSDLVFDVLFFTFIFLLIVLALWILIRTNKLIRQHLADPLEDITHCLHQGSLPNSKHYIEEFQYLVNQVQLFYKNKDKIAIARLAKQAAHDLRSPLVAIETVLRKATTPSESEILILKSATRQIHDITNNLLQQNVSKETIHTKKVHNVMLTPILDYVISEKNIEISNADNPIDFKVNLDQEVYTCFIKVIPAEMKRILSNLCNNAIESLKTIKKPQLKVDINIIGRYVRITISDNGCGISSEQSLNIFDEGISYKEAGSGLGLFHAKENISQWNGRIWIESEVEMGTQVYIELPIQPQAPWFGDTLVLLKTTKLVVVDDSKSIHDQWNQFITEFKHLSRIELISFLNPDEFIEWYKTLPCEHQDYTFLIDQEFTGFKTTGLDILKLMKPISHRFLVTSYGEYFDLHQTCMQLSIKLIPKFYFPHLHILIRDELANIIILEPSPILLAAYRIRAEKHKTSADFFDNAQVLLNEIRLYPCKTRIYISEAYADTAKTLQEIGFNNLVIITHNDDELESIPVPYARYVHKDFEIQP